MREILHNLQTRMQKAKQNIEGIAQAMKVRPTMVQRQWDPRGWGRGGRPPGGGGRCGCPPVHPLRPTGFEIRRPGRGPASSAATSPLRPAGPGQLCEPADRSEAGNAAPLTPPSRPAPSQDWSANPLFERKDNKKEALLDLDGRLTNLNKRYTAVKEAGIKIQAMVAVRTRGLGFP